MILWIRNIYRKIIGKPTISNISLTKEDCYTAQEFFDRMSGSHEEVLLICIEHPRFERDNSAEIKCYAKLSLDDSIIRDMIRSDVIHEFLNGEQ